MVGEGIEPEGVLRQLEAFGCDQAQGLYLARPMPAAVLEQWLRSSNHYAVGDFASRTA